MLAIKKLILATQRKIKWFGNVSIHKNFPKKCLLRLFHHHQRVSLINSLNFESIVIVL